MTTTTENILSKPLRGASFGQAFSRFWSKYATFTGRASASEFWWASLFVSIPSMVLTSTVISATGLWWLLSLWQLATIIPMLAISWRRLHDTGRSGGNWFFILIPVVGWIILLVQLTGDPNPAGERFDA
jgi:uncharacterized membrane protein YhaH (DUF805 family)